MCSSHPDEPTNPHLISYQILWTLLWGLPLLFTAFHCHHWPRPASPPQPLTAPPHISSLPLDSSLSFKMWSSSCHFPTENSSVTQLYSAWPGLPHTLRSPASPHSLSRCTVLVTPLPFPQTSPAPSCHFLSLPACGSHTSALVWLSLASPG